MQKLIPYILLLFISTNLYSQKEDSVSLSKSIILGGITVGGFTVGQIAQYDKYWSEPSEFHFMSMKTEYDDALLADKFGHLYFSYALGKTYAKMVEWTGLNKETSTWIGFAVSNFHQTYVEINDGFSDGKPYLGFSWGDVAANSIGSSIPVIQYYYPIAENFKLKVSYIKSDNFEKHNYASVFDDYESTYHWLSVDIFKLLEIDEGIIPGMFSPAIGHSVKNIDRHGAGYHEIYLGLDLNWGYLKKFDFVKNSYYLQLLIDVLDKYKFPLPAIRLNRGVEGVIR